MKHWVLAAGLCAALGVLLAACDLKKTQDGGQSQALYPVGTLDEGRAARYPADSAVPPQEKAKTQTSLKEVLAGNTEKPVLWFLEEDYDQNGTKEAFAFVQEGDPEEELSCVMAKIWYVDANHAEMIFSGGFYPDPEIWDAPPMKMLKIEEGYGGSGSVSHLWTVRDNKPVDIKNTGEGLQQAQGRDFYIHPSAYDHAEDGSGHTWKRYYLFWDGGQLREYGGLQISQEELAGLKGTEEILALIKEREYEMGEIYYRENGIININLHKGGLYENVTLEYRNGEAAPVTAADWEEDALLKFSYGGSYEAAYYPDIAVYPQSLPE